MHRKRSPEQRALEFILIIVVLAATGLFQSMPTFRLVILHLYILPVTLAGCYIGRYCAAVMALLCTVAVTIAVSVNDFDLANGMSTQSASLSIIVWGGVLVLTGMLVGTLSDEFRQKMMEMYESHQMDTLYDPLTNVANRRAFQYESNRRLAECNRNQVPLALMLIDIDHFKKFNDTYGHRVGDAVLRDVARTIQSAIRQMDLVARYGGEEFGVILPGTPLAEAKDVAERVRKVIEDSRFRFEGWQFRLTVSIGVACFRSGDEADALVGRADAALYASKQAGRNCAHLHTGDACEHFGTSLLSPPARTDQDEAVTNVVPDKYSDRVTGLPSRKVFNEELRRRVSEAERYDLSLSIMLVEVDDFRSIDARGPQAADMVLAMTAEFLRVTLRTSDMIARYTTSQLAVLLPATPVPEACVPAQRVRGRVFEYDELKYQGSPLSFTVSIGLAQLSGAEGAMALLERVEHAVHTASSGGGNCVHLHDGSISKAVPVEAACLRESDAPV